LSEGVKNFQGRLTTQFFESHEENSASCCVLTSSISNDL